MTEDDIELVVWVGRPYHIPSDEFASFTEKYPNISVTYDIFGEDDILQQIQRMADAGQRLPDIILDDSPVIGSYLELGLLRPIEDVLERWEEEDPESFEKVLPSVWEQGTYEGEVIGMPLSANFNGVYYNIPWFQEAGVDVPFESLEEVFEAAMALKDARPNLDPLSAKAIAGGGAGDLFVFLTAAGVPFDGAVPDLTSDAGVYVIDWWLRMQANDLMPEDAISWGDSEARGAFIAGRAGIIIDGLSTGRTISEVPDFTLGTDWASTPIPLSMTGDSQDGTVLSTHRTWSITEDSHYPYEASLLLRHIADTEVILDMVGLGQLPPRQTEALQDPRLDDHLPWFTEQMKEVFVIADSLPVDRNSAGVSRILEELLGEIVVGTDEAAEGLAERYQAELDELG